MSFWKGEVKKYGTEHINTAEQMNEVDEYFEIDFETEWRDTFLLRSVYGLVCYRKMDRILYKQKKNSLFFALTSLNFILSLFVLSSYVYLIHGQITIATCV